MLEEPLAPVELLELLGRLLLDELLLGVLLLLGELVLDELLLGALLEPELEPLIPEELDVPPAAPVVELEPDLLN